MGVKWRDFQMPKRLDCEENSYTNIYGKFVAEPFERGYGVTLGVIHCDVFFCLPLKAHAVTSIHVSQGVSHEFSTLSGVMESDDRDRS